MSDEEIKNPVAIKPIRVGRPSVITNEILHKLKKAFLMDCTDAEACIVAGIARSTLSEYKRLNPEFSDNVQSWKLNPILKARTTIYNNLDNINIAKWYLERKCPEEFALKVIVNNINANFIQNNILVEIIEPQRTDYNEVARQAGEALKELSKKDHLV